ncbi:MAG TPA: SAM-dependent methyltransferase [Bacillota bacterium]|nr:SAM-dependent methyltransferase [Bacillota bacterium]
MSKVEPINKWDLNRIVFIGRVWDEYMRMFNLTQGELMGRKILDCPAGACSFTAVSNRLGMDVTACDIAYHHPVDELEQKGLQDIETTMFNMEKADIQKNFLWDYFKSVDELKQIRTQALNECISDMKQNDIETRYIPAVLPTLPFGDKQFDLTLSANFLFLYEDRLDYEFHLQTIEELMRVTKNEIRIFPTTNFACERYKYLDEIIRDIQNLGWNTEEISVDYEFQKNTNTMLKIVK